MFLQKTLKSIYPLRATFLRTFSESTVNRSCDYRIFKTTGQLQVSFAPPTFKRNEIGDVVYENVEKQGSLMLSFVLPYETSIKSETRKYDYKKMKRISLGVEDQAQLLLDIPSAGLTFFRDTGKIQGSTTKEAKSLKISAADKGFFFQLSCDNQKFSTILVTSPELEVIRAVIRKTIPLCLGYQ